MVDGRGADPEMDLLRARPAQQPDDLLGGGAADDGVVHHDQALVADDLAQRRELDVDAPLAHRLRGLDERPAAVAVADHALAVRDARRLGEPGRRRGARVRHRHHQVRGRRVLRRELHPHLAPRLVQVAALHVGVRTGEVDELEDAQGRRRRRVADRDRLAAGLQDHDLAGLHVAHELGAHDVERRGLRGEDPAARVVAPESRGIAAGEREPAEDERPEPVRVPDADDALLVEHDEAEGPAHPGQDAPQGVHRVLCRLVGEERGQELRVGAGGEAAAPPEQLLQQLAGVDEVPVVPDGERPARPQAQRGLGVLPDRRARGRVPAMRHREVARERRDPPLVEDLADHAQVLVDHQVGPVRDPDARRLLAPVLEREQRRRGHRRRLVAAVGQDDPDDAAHQEATSAPGSAASAT